MSKAGSSAAWRIPTVSWKGREASVRQPSHAMQLPRAHLQSNMGQDFL